MVIWILNKFTLFLINKRYLFLLFIIIVLVFSLFQVISSKNNFLTGIGEISGSESNHVKRIVDSNFTNKISYDLIITSNQNIKTSDQNKLLNLLNDDPLIENTYSNKVLEKNRFELLGVVMDPEDGEVWEWEYNK